LKLRHWIVASPVARTAREIRMRAASARGASYRHKKQGL